MLVFYTKLLVLNEQDPKTDFKKQTCKAFVEL